MKKLFSSFAALLLLASCSNQTVISSQAEPSSSAETSSISLPESSNIAEQNVLADIVFETYEFDNYITDKKTKLFIDFPTGLTSDSRELTQNSAIIPEDIKSFNKDGETVVSMSFAVEFSYAISGNIANYDIYEKELQIANEPIIEHEVAFFYSDYFINSHYAGNSLILNVYISKVDSRTETSIQLTSIGYTCVNFYSERALPYILYILDSIKIVEL